MTLSESQKKYLRGLGHGLKPVVMIGDAGLTEAVLSEFNDSVEHHELIKVRVKVGDRAERDRIIAVEEDIRRRLARDLHDGPAQLLAARKPC